MILTVIENNIGNNNTLVSYEAKNKGKWSWD